MTTFWVVTFALVIFAYEIEIFEKTFVTVALDALVILPYWSMVICGTFEDDPYGPAVTPLVGKFESEIVPKSAVVFTLEITTLLALFTLPYWSTVN